MTLFLKYLTVQYLLETYHPNQLHILKLLKQINLRVTVLIPLTKKKQFNFVNIKQYIL